MYMYILYVCKHISDIQNHPKHHMNLNAYYI